MIQRVDLRQRQDQTRYAFVEFGSPENVKAILAAGSFTLDGQSVSAATIYYVSSRLQMANTYFYRQF